VLFADVVRSMDLAARLEPERLREVMSELFNRCGAVVQRYGGTVDKFTGDGIMAIFGAPIALEDHAVRACLAALDIQGEARRLATDVHRRDGVEYALRVGLNSGEVVTGQIGVGPTSYTAVGAQVGMAQRMESVAPAGGVMLSESTARLVEYNAVLGDSQMFDIKGSNVPIPARLLRAMGPKRWPQLRHESALIGREGEIRSITGLLDDAMAGRGHVITISGPPGIGKSRIGREITDLADARGIKTYATFCESHARDMPFYVISRLLRNVFGVDGLDEVTARGRIRARVTSADPEDVQLLEELLGVAEARAHTGVSADARRRRLSHLVVSALAGRRQPAVFIVEDVHWIDDISEAMLTDIVSALPRTSVFGVVTYRPEYRGSLHKSADAVRFVLAPLDDSQATVLAAELMGADPSVGPLAEHIVDRAAGNPFFVHELIRDLAERKIIDGEAGAYTCRSGVADVTVPPTLQAAIASRIDRLTTGAKQLLNAASVIGSQFATDLLSDIAERERDSIQPEMSELVHAELVFPVVLASSTEYAFRHPMIRTVAEESQLKSMRSTLHRRLAAAIEHQHQADDENASLVASHLEAAGDLRDAFGWYMRAGSWFVNRDIGAARANWQHARQIADRLPVDEPGRMTMRIAPRSLLCGSAWRAGGSVADTGFEELRDLCTSFDSRIPLVMGMAGLMSSLSVHARIRESADLAPHYVEQVDSLENRTLTVGLLFPAIFANCLVGKMRETRRLAQRVIDGADGNATMGNILTGSPLAFATAMRAIARLCLGERGWCADFDSANTVAHQVDPTTFVSTVTFKHVTGIALGALVPDAAALAETEEALHIAQRYSEDMALGLAQLARGMTLINCGDHARRPEGFMLLRSARELAVQERYAMSDVPIIDIETAAESARLGDVDSAITSAGRVLDDLDRSGGAIYRGAATTVLITSLLARRAEGDLERARAAIESLAAAPSDEGSVMNDLPLMRLRALLAAETGEEQLYRQLADRYRARAHVLAFDGHILNASAMN
jgi:class 3 adenylate cyclase